MKCISLKALNLKILNDLTSLNLFICVDPQALVTFVAQVLEV